MTEVIWFLIGFFFGGLFWCIGFEAFLDYRYSTLRVLVDRIKGKKSGYVDRGESVSPPTKYVEFQNGRLSLVHRIEQWDES
jgi:hypothetical protein